MENNEPVLRKKIPPPRPSHRMSVQVEPQFFNELSTMVQGSSRLNKMDSLMEGRVSLAPSKPPNKPPPLPKHLQPPLTNTPTHNNTPNNTPNNTNPNNNTPNNTSNNSVNTTVNNTTSPRDGTSNNSNGVGRGGLLKKPNIPPPPPRIPFSCDYTSL